MYSKAKKLSRHIFPAVLEIDPKKQLQRMEKLAPYSHILHTDVMDGKFVKAKNLKVLKTLSRPVGAGRDLPLLELHLMVQEPVKLFSDIRKIKKVKRVILQFESDWKPAFDKFKKRYEVGIALKPKTPPSILPFVRGGKKAVVPPLSRGGIRGGGFGFDSILLLSVTPGAQGNPFKSNIYARVKEVRKLFPKLRIEIDGGMNPARIKRLKKLGAKDFVVGSYLKEGNLAKKIASLARF